MAITLQTSFNAGYWNPKLQNRADVSLYRKAGSKIENFFIYPEGGLRKRDATEYLGEVIDSNHKSLLVPYQYSTTEIYVLEFSGNGTMRVLKLGTSAPTAIEVLQSGISTGLTDDELDDLHWCQVLHKMYFSHKNHPPKVFQKVTTTTFLLKDYVPYPPAQRDNSYTLGSKLQLAALTGNYVYFNFVDSSGNNTYELLPGDVGRYLVGRGDKGFFGYGVIVDIQTQDANHEYYHEGHMDIIEPFSAGAIDAPNYFLQGNGGSKINIDHKEAGPEGKIINVKAKVEHSDDSLWRTADVGRMIELNKGFIRLSTYEDHRQIKAIVVKCLDDGNETPYWQMSLPEWDNAYAHGNLNTYPMTVNFYQNRLFFGGTVEKPGKIWGSRSMYLKDFTSNADDEYALQYLLSGNYLSEIKWMIGGAVLVVGTSNGIWTIGREDSSAVLTPSSPMLGLRSTIACSKVRPTSSGNWVFFVERNRTKMHVILGSANIDPSAAMPEDLTLFANPFSPNVNPIQQIIAQSNPNIVVWVIDESGDLWGMNYSQQQKIQSWFKYTTSSNNMQTKSYYESMMLYPQYDDIDRLWVVVKRYINGAWHRYIERFTMVACDSLRYNAYGTATNTPNGFDHLIGEKVWVWCSSKNDSEGNGWLRGTDGNMALLTVDANGAIDASGYGYTSTGWGVGLPYNAEAKTMNWYEGLQDTKYQKLKKISRVRVGVYKSSDGQVGVQVGNQDIKTAIPEEPTYINIFETPPGIDPETKVEEYTGMIERSIDVPIGREMKLCIKHDNPEFFAITSLGCDMV